jgi:cytochrome c5
MMKPLKIIYSALLLAAAPMLSQTANTAPTQSNSATAQVKNNIVAVHERDGQRVFDQNCSRCHNTPQGFSPRIAGTVARHMRVRANLSKEDEQAILRFLNP